MSKRKKREDRQHVSGENPNRIREILGEGQLRIHVLESKDPVVVDCWAPWCGPCRLMGPILDQVSKDYQGSVGFAKLNTQANPQIAQKLNIRSIPTLLIFHGGEVVDVSIGVTPADRLHKMIRRVLDKQEGIGFWGRIKRLWKKPKAQKASQEANDGNV